MCLFRSIYKFNLFNQFKDDQRQFILTGNKFEILVMDQDEKVVLEYLNEMHVVEVGVLQWEKGPLLSKHNEICVEVKDNLLNIHESNLLNRTWNGKGVINKKIA